jgi:hypothetical protein
MIPNPFRIKPPHGYTSTVSRWPKDLRSIHMCAFLVIIRKADSCHCFTIIYRNLGETEKETPSLVDARS